MTYFQIRYKMDGKWRCSKVIMDKGQAYTVYQEWASCMMLLEPIGLRVPCRLCRVELGVVHIEETNELRDVVQ